VREGVFELLEEEKGTMEGGPDEGQVDGVAIGGREGGREGGRGGGGSTPDFFGFADGG